MSTPTEDDLSNGSGPSALAVEHLISSDVGYPLSAKAQVLADPDRLKEIFSLFGKITNQDLLLASLACHKFLEVVPRKQWVCLIKTIPSVICKDGRFVANGILLEEHLIRFDYYARRIKVLYMDAKTYNIVSYDVASFIALYRQSTGFPILQTLTFVFNDRLTQGVSTLFLLASGALSALTISGVSSLDEFFATSLLHVTSIKSKQLVDLTLEGKLTHSTLDIMPKFNKIQRLDINQSGVHHVMDLLSRMAHFENLRILTLTFPSRITSLPTTTPSTFAAELPELYQLTLQGGIRIVDHFLNSITAVQLARITIDLRGYNPSLGDEDLIRSIGRFFSSAPCVQYINIYGGIWRGSLSLPSNWFPDILAWRHLREVTVPLVPLAAHHLSLPGLPGQRWTLLEVIDLTGGFGEFGTSPLLLSQIHLFVEHFPNLKQLSMPLSLRMDSSEIKRMGTHIKKERSCYKLQKLCLCPVIANLSAWGEDEHEGDSYSKQCSTEFGPLTHDITDLVVTSQFIDHIFPHLVELSMGKLFYVDAGWRTAFEVGVKTSQQTRMRVTRDHSCA
ncbi:hypothetical protein CVT25_007624 [Psilocybe cyanescens]|uniref:F-box domain-containing protein n=1 Tax=Psilocybe cyanescens TaxID=93625 RepID=A0A409X1A5_PSICY|nr:hypothetical protein CVT25_007624 [Psilocybe cyanescens]